eukprot:m.242623 g.242623  ORF g.242623 m.242623 type:complete len:353 (-) comp16096_c0_seq17:3827-4885(-)
MLNFINRGDILAIALPYVPKSTDENGRYWLEYGSATLLYCVAGDGSQSDASQKLSQTLCNTMNPATQNHEFQFCEGFENRIMIKDLQPHMRFATIVGVVVALSGKKFTEGEETGSLFIIRIEDSSGVLDVNFYTEKEHVVDTSIMHRVLNARIGQLVLIEGINVKPISTPPGINCLCTRDGGSLRCLSYVSSLLPFSNSRYLLCDIMRSCSPDCFMIKAIITRVHRNTPYMAHATCGYPITDKDDQQACAFCKQLDTLQKETRVNVEIEIDDGSLCTIATLSSRAWVELFGGYGAWIKLPKDLQEKQLSDKVGMLALMCVCRVPNGSIGLRIDSFFPDNATSRLENLISLTL